MQVRTYMLKNIFIIFLMMAALGCKKQNNLPQSLTQAGSASQDNKGAENEATSNFNLEVVLNGEGNTNGHIHFRQDPDPAKIITLDTKIHHLLPNHEYLLQRAVDPI